MILSAIHKCDECNHKAYCGEPITFSPKEEIILLEILYKDIKHFKPISYSGLTII